METGNIQIITFKTIKAQNWDDYLSVKNNQRTNLIIDFPIKINGNNFTEFGDDLNFKNCVFNYEIKIENIENSLLEITFINCKFNDSLNINRNKLKELTIVWHSETSYSQYYSTINSLFAKKMSISGNKFEMTCKIKKLNQTNDSTFIFIGNVFLKEPRELYPNLKTDYTICEISNCHLNNGSFNGNIFHLPFDFTNNSLKYNLEYSGYTFKGNKFQKSFFSETDFGKTSEFFDCDFNGTTIFDKIKNIDNTKLHFKSCKFTGFAHFGNASISNFIIKYSTFEKPASFKEIIVNDLLLSEVKFEKGAYFDDILIKNVENKNYLKNKTVEVIKEWKHTLRLVKQELQKTENKIDFNRFRAYELATHYKELNWKWKSGFKDKSILWATKWSTDFGNSWRRALAFTIVTGLFWYTILYRIENSGAFNYNKINDYFVGAFRFFLVTDFYNPLIDSSRVYLINGFSWLIFIIGKIFIAFGIYEMIQSFRKFKA